MDYNSGSNMMHKDEDFDGYNNSHVSHNSGNGSHLQINKNVTGMSKAELRKVGLKLELHSIRTRLLNGYIFFLLQTNKPIMEKKRRARINHCLNELKTLILEAMKKDVSILKVLKKSKTRSQSSHAFPIIIITLINILFPMKSIKEVYPTNKIRKKKHKKKQPISFSALYEVQCRQTMYLLRSFLRLSSLSQCVGIFGFFSSLLKLCVIQRFYTWNKKFEVSFL